ncbi:uncharacterized protein [Littorina saxatilis]|uniref:Uncharacterized protein n=1 Tax=Littorina saxatilis TaxID=31220 RepID=A0AAN9GIJ9_9CAEN
MAGVVGPVSLLLSCVLLASSAQCMTEFMIFDIKGNLSSDEVINVFCDYNVRYIFRVTLAQRFIVVMPNVSQSDLAGLTIPSAEVTSYVAERSDEFYASFGAGKENVDRRDLHGKDQMLVEVEFTMQELSLRKYKRVFKKIGDHLQTIKREFAVHGYHLLGYLPPRIMALSYYAGKVANSMIEKTGSPAYIRLKTSPVLRVL